MATAALPEELLDSIRAGNCVLFVGAGFTSAVAAQVPTQTPVPDAPQLASFLLTELAAELGRGEDYLRSLIDSAVGVDAKPSLRWASQLFITELLASGQEQPVDARRRLLSLVRRKVEVPFADELLTHMQFLTSIPWRAIYTTNYDLLIETALAYHGRRHKTVTRSHDVLDLDDEAVEVVKIHGSIDELHLDAHLRLVVTEEDYAEFGLSRRLLLDKLRLTLAQHEFLFLGYGLKDETFMNVFREVQSELHRSSRTVFLQQRQDVDTPFHRYLRSVGIVSFTAPSIPTLTSELPEVLDSFRTAHDRGYLGFVASRAEPGSSRALYDVAAARAALSRAVFEADEVPRTVLDAGRAAGASSVESLAILIMAKHPPTIDESQPGADPLTVHIRRGLAELEEIAADTPAVFQWHRALEVMRCAAPYLEGSELASLIRVVRAGLLGHPDALTTWLSILVLRALERVPGAKEAMTPIVNLLERAASAPESDVGISIRPVIPAAAKLLAHFPPNGVDPMLRWEYWRTSRATFRVDLEGDALRINGLDCIVATSRPLAETPDSFAASAAWDEPLLRRLYLRRVADEALATGSDAFLAQTLGTYLESELTASVPAPFFASFTVLEALAERAQSGEFSRFVALYPACLAFCEAALESCAHDAPPVARAWAEHFITAAHTRVMVHLADAMPFFDDPSWRDITDRVSNIEAGVFRVAADRPWTLENVLNIYTYLSSSLKFRGEAFDWVRDLAGDLLSAGEAVATPATLSPLHLYYLDRIAYGYSLALR